MGGVAVVTGGTRGIGEAIATALKDTGHKVAANYGGNDEAAKAFTERTGIPSYKFDVSDFDACQKGVRQIERDLGPITILVNNAGITRDGTLHKMDYEKKFPKRLQLPATLWEAAQRLKASKVAREWLGDAFVDHYAATREWEEREFRKHITDWEMERYFEII